MITFFFVFHIPFYRYYLLTTFSSDKIMFSTARWLALLSHLFTFFSFFFLHMNFSRQCTSPIYMKHISCITCFAFDKSFILEDFLQEATNWQFLSQLGPETLRLAGFSGHHYFHTFYKYLAIQILQFYDFSLMDFQDTIISTHFTNIIPSKYCSFMTFP